MTPSLAAKAAKEKTTKQGYGRVDAHDQGSVLGGVYGDVLGLQRSVGNRAVGQALKSGATHPGAIQGKMTIGQPGDKYEQEADRVADQVMRMPDSEVGTNTPSVTLVQTQSVQRDASSGQAPTVTPSIQAKIEGLQRGGGEPLPEGVRGFMEPRLGRDLSAVRIHLNLEANDLAANMKAKAFTVGSHIAFAKGQFLSSKSANNRLLAHELVHTQQQQSFGQSVIQRTPEDKTISESSIDIESNDVELESQLNRVPSEDLVKANSKLEKQLNRLNYKMEIVLRAVFGEQRGDEDIFESDVSENQLKMARRAVSRYRKITRILEAFPQLDIAFAAKWLNVLTLTIRVLRKTLKELSVSGEVGALIADGLDRQLRRISNNARKLRSKKVIQRGAKLARTAEEAAQDAQRAEFESKLPEALAKITSDTQLQTNGLSDIEIDIEIQQLQFKKQLEANPVKIQVLDAMIKGLASGKVEDRGSPETTITDQAQEIVKIALNDTSQASRMIARRLREQTSDLQSLTVVLDAFRLLNDESETRVDVIRGQVLMQLGPEALGELRDAKKGSRAELVLDWLAPNFRKDLQFAVSFAKKPVGNVTTNNLLSVKDSERPAAVAAAIQSVNADSLRTLAHSPDGRKLLIEMAFQLWSKGYKKQYESVGDEIANAVAPSRGFKGEAIQLPALPGISLGIRTSGRKIIVSMDSLDLEQAVAAGFDRGYVNKLFVSGVEIDPEDIIVIKERADELGFVRPALKLLEMKARGDKTLLGLGALKLRESAEEAKDIIGTSALNLIRNQERKLEGHVNKARTYLYENVPEEYRFQALTALEIFADAGRLALSVEAHAIGSAVGITKGAIDFGTGAVETAGLVSETASDFEKARKEGRVFDELKVKADDVSNTVKVAMVVAPEQVAKAVQDINMKLAKAGIAEKALIVSEIEGRIAFEVATTVAGAKAPSVLGRLKGLKRLPSTKPLPTKPNLRAPRRPSSKELPVTERIIDKELQKEIRQLGPANEHPRLPPETEAAELRQVAGVEGTGHVGQLPQTGDAIPSPDLRVLPGGVPTASIKGKPKSSVPSTSAPSPSPETRSLSPPDRTTGSATGTTRSVIEREKTVLDDLQERGLIDKPRISKLDEFLDEERLQKQLSPEGTKGSDPNTASNTASDVRKRSKEKVPEAKAKRKRAEEEIRRTLEKSSEQDDLSSTPVEAFVRKEINRDLAGETVRTRKGTFRGRSAGEADRARVTSRRPTSEEVGKAKIKDSEALGIEGGLKQAKKEGIDDVPFKHPDEFLGEFGKGIDAIGKKGDKWIIMEFKGGPGGDLKKPKKSGTMQMSDKWVGEKIAELEAVNHPMAETLKKAVKEGELQGVVYKTEKDPSKGRRLNQGDLKKKLKGESIDEEGLITFDFHKVEKARENKKNLLDKRKEKLEKKFRKKK